jgi:hypothetical protein
VTLAVKLDTQLRKAFAEYVRRSGKSKSQAARALLRSALGIKPADGADAEIVMAAVGKAKAQIGLEHRRGRT